MCRCCLRGVRRFSYWFDKLGFISEGNTYRRCAASSLPLWGNTDVASSDITLLSLLSSLLLHSFYIYIYLYSYKKTELVMMVCLPSYNIGRPIYISRIGRELWQFCEKVPTHLSTIANKAFPRLSFSLTR